MLAAVYDRWQAEGFKEFRNHGPMKLKATLVEALIWWRLSAGCQRRASSRRDLSLAGPRRLFVGRPRSERQIVLRVGHLDVTSTSPRPMHSIVPGVAAGAGRIGVGARAVLSARGLKRRRCATGRVAVFDPLAWLAARSSVIGPARQCCHNAHGIPPDRIPALLTELRTPLSSIRPYPQRHHRRRHQGGRIKRLAIDAVIGDQESELLLLTAGGGSKCHPNSPVPPECQKELAYSGFCLA